MDKQSRRDKYDDKKNNKDKHKIKKQVQTEEDKAFLQQVSNYSPEKLLKFLEDKYDDYVYQNEKLGFKLNNEVGKRLIQIPSQIDANQVKKLKNYLQAEGIKVSDANIQKVFDNRQVAFDSQNLKANIQGHDKNAWILKLIFNDTKPNMYVRKVCIHKVPKELYHNPLNKRMKKQATQVLQNLMDFIKSIDTYQKN